MNSYSPLVSIMMPFHNAAGTIERALRSVCGQTYRPLQVILVDDGSTDDSPLIISRFIKENVREGLEFTCKHIAKSGVGAARKVALELAKGEYMTAVDADDYASPDAIEAYVEATRDGNVDLVAAGVYYDYGNRQEPVLFKPGERLCLEDTRIDSLHFLLTNKLIRVSSLRAVEPFITGHNCWEDLGAISRVLASGASTLILPDAYYHYVQNTSGSLTCSASDYILEQHILVTLSLEQWLKEHGLYSENEGFMHYLKFIAKVKFMRPVNKFLRHPHRQLRGWRNTFPEANRSIMRLKKVPLKYRLLFSLASRMARLLPS